MQELTDQEREVVDRLVAAGIWQKLDGVMIYGRWLKGGLRVNKTLDPLTHPDAHVNAAEEKRKDGT